MAGNESLRNSILADSNQFADKRRFGLFSQPISTAIGDDGNYRTKIHPRNEQGKPQTGPRNIYASPNKSGKSRSSYFGPLNSLATHERRDIFMEEGLRLIKEQHQTFSTNRKQANFYPIAGIKPITNLAYQYVAQNNPQLDPKRFKLPDGRVKSGPRNFYTNPQSKVVDTTFKHYTYMEDPYQRKHERQTEHLKKSKALEQQVPFVPNHFHPKTISSDKSIYGLDRDISKLPPKEAKLSIMHHESPWSPASSTKQGLNGYFEPVHKYMESPPQERRISISPKEREAFRGMSPEILHKPSPSVSLNRVNMLGSINRSMRLKN